MISAELQVHWRDYEDAFQPIRPGRWGLRLILGGAANQLGRHMQAHDYLVDRVEDTLQLIDDVVAGRVRPGQVGGDNDGFVAYGNGYFFVASNYEEKDQLVVTADVFRGAFEWLRDLITDPDFTNPDAVGRFGPFVVELVTHGLGAEGAFMDLGGSMFVEVHPNDDHLN